MRTHTIWIEEKQINFDDEPSEKWLVGRPTKTWVYDINWIYQK
jgi:hypothetical protein